MTNQDDWKKNAKCKGLETNLFFDDYEEDEELRKDIDEFCSTCPLARHCFAVGISNKEWGVWGGVYLENGKVSKEFGKHRTKAEWAATWQYLTMDKK
jgi:hypothetical protein